MDYIQEFSKYCHFRTVILNEYFYNLIPRNVKVNILV